LLLVFTLAANAYNGLISLSQLLLELLGGSSHLLPNFLELKMGRLLKIGVLLLQKDDLQLQTFGSLHLQSLLRNSVVLNSWLFFL
jgi:hypothetical protein